MTFTRAFKISLMAFAALFALAFPARAIVGGAKPHLDGVGRAVVVIVGSRGNFCSGAAIARDLVLTAAHCVLPGADYKIVRYQDGAKPALIDTAKIMRHPQFSLASLQGQRATADVALIKLANPLPDGISPAPVGAPRLPINPGARFTIAGAGVARAGDGTSGGTVRAVGLIATGRPGTLQIRLMDPNTKANAAGLGACTGDSGAPAFEDQNGRAIIIGVVSWSTGPNLSAGCGGLTGLTPLNLYRDWILQAARQLGTPLQ